MLLKLLLIFFVSNPLVLGEVQQLVASDNTITGILPGSGKINNGVIATKENWKFIVLVSNSFINLCGGVIINSEWVLSTAWCCSNAQISSFTLIAGEYNRNSNEGTEQTRNVDNSFIHPQYTGGSPFYNYNLALLHVSTPFQLSDDVQPVQLPFNGHTPTPQLRIAGWDSSTILREKSVTYISDAVCRQTHPVILESHYCTSATSGPNLWTGDLGGPAMCDNTLCGLMTNAWTGGRPDLYTEVSYFRDWIDSIVGVEPEPTSDTPQPETTEPTTFISTTETTIPPSSTTRPPPSTTSRPPNDFDCPSDDGLYLDPKNCRGFYNCANWIPYHFCCPLPLFFNQLIEKCDFPDMVECQNDPTLPCDSPPGKYI